MKHTWNSPVMDVIDLNGADVITTSRYYNEEKESSASSGGESSKRSWSLPTIGK